MEHITTLTTTDADVERILKGSVLLESEKAAHKKTFLKLQTLGRHLSKFLDEFEGKWDSDEQCASPEIAQDYIDAAKYMADNFQRINNRIREVEVWLNDYVPFS